MCAWCFLRAIFLVEGIKEREEKDAKKKKKSMIKLRSLRARIFLLILVIGLVPCIVMRHGI